MFSIITVSFNSCSTIENTIKSVIAQSYSDYEYLVIDGGSTDGTLDLLEMYSDNISKIISEPDKGIYDAMNKGIAKSNHPFIIFLNSDDSFHDKDVLIQLYKAIDKSQDNTIYYTDYVKVFRNKSVRIEVVKNLTLKNFYWKQPINHQSTIFPKRLFKKVGLYDLSIGNAADYFWYIRSFDFDIVYKYIPITTTLFSMEGATSNTLFKNYLTRMRIAYKIYPLSIKLRYIFMLPVFYLKFKLIKSSFWKLISEK